MRIIPLLAVAATLAACADRADHDRPAPAADRPAASTSPATPRAADAWPELPDFADPRVFLDIDSEDWLRTDPAPMPVDDDRLRALGIVPVRPPDDAGTGERTEDFRLMDFSGDGVADVIYDGGVYEMRDGEFAAMEGSRLGLYRVQNGRAQSIFSEYTSLQRVFGPANAPRSLRTVQMGCCGETAWTIEYFRPVGSGDAPRYEPYHRVLGTTILERPSDYFPTPRRFTVRNDGYLLRSEPSTTADPDQEFAQWPGHGNALAIYGPGARGIALAEQTDATGRVWWFVLMDGRTPPRDAMIPENAEDDVPEDRLGWMSSRFVEVDG